MIWSSLIFLTISFCVSFCLQYISVGLLQETSSFKVRVQHTKSFWVLTCAGACALTSIFVFTSVYYWCANFIFVGALIVNTSTDLQELVIVRWASLYLVPVGWLCALFGILPIPFWHSVFASVIAYVFLWALAHIFTRMLGQQAMGEGDFELIALIGSFTGLFGSATSLFVGSFVGACVGLVMILARKSTFKAKIPFGPFLSLGGLIALLWPLLIVSRLGLS